MAHRLIINRCLLLFKNTHDFVLISLGCVLLSYVHAMYIIILLVEWTNFAIAHILPPHLRHVVSISWTRLVKCHVSEQLRVCFPEAAGIGWDSVPFPGQFLGS